MTKNKGKWIALFIMPCMLLFAIIYVVPLITIFATSFCKYTAFVKPNFIGFSNYIELFKKGSNFWVAMKNTVVWVAIQCILNVALGTLVAILIRRKPFGWKLIRTAYMIPNIIPTAATGVMFYLMLNPEFGVIKPLLNSLGIEKIPNLFGNSSYAFFTVTLTWVLYAGITMIIVMAEISAIPEDVYESAKVDGATILQTELRITLPMLKNVICTCVILAAVGMVSQFDIIYVTTKGGPGSATLNLPIYLFKTATLEMNYGMANAIGVFQVILGLVLVAGINGFFRFGNTRD